MKEKETMKRKERMKRKDRKEIMKRKETKYLPLLLLLLSELSDSYFAYDESSSSLAKK